MLTIFSIPKAFQGLSQVLQTNALKSWQALGREVQILLLGDDPGVAEAAQRFGCQHLPEIKRNELGTPLLDHAFALAQAEARHGFMLYVNADIILFPSLFQALDMLQGREFLVCGRRIDLDLTDDLDVGYPGWADELLDKARKQGTLHGYSGLDYFLFPKGLVRLPPFAVGRPGWDNWLLFAMQQKNVPVIDATAVVTIIHQNHDYSHSPFGGRKQVRGPELVENIRIAGGRHNLLTLREADYLLTLKGLVRPPFSRRIFNILGKWSLWRYLLGAKRTLQDYLLKGQKG